MVPLPTFEVEFKSFNTSFEDWVTTAHIGICDAYRQQGRLLCERIISGPLGSAGKRGIATPPETRKQGQAAVKRDIYRAVFPIKAKGFRNLKLRRRISDAVAALSYEALQTMARAGVFGQGLVGAQVQPFQPSMHESQRRSRGRVHDNKGNYKFATPNTDALAQYVKKKQGNVGQAKGGWVESLIRLGGHTAAWIAKHARAGAFEDRLKPGATEVGFTMINRSAWASGGDEDRIIQQAMAYREGRIREDIETMMSGTWTGRKRLEQVRQLALR